MRKRGIFLFRDGKGIDMNFEGIEWEREHSLHLRERVEMDTVQGRVGMGATFCSRATV